MLIHGLWVVADITIVLMLTSDWWLVGYREAMVGVEVLRRLL